MAAGLAVLLLIVCMLRVCSAQPGLFRTFRKKVCVVFLVWFLAVMRSLVYFLLPAGCLEAVTRAITLRRSSIPIPINVAL